MPSVRQVLLGLVVSCTSGAGLAAAQAPAAGETTTAPTDRAEPAEPARPAFEEEILVTGSRIRRKDLTTPAPVTVIGREDIARSGRVSVGDLLQSLPEQANATNRQWNNGGDGSTRVSLRGLGDYRTLVLLNGRRFVAGGTGANDSVDLGSIPSAAVERIEILKDGASPIYGSDALGGVVNIITRRRWSGTEASAYVGASSRRDGNVYDLQLTTGRAGDAGSVLFSAGYTKEKEIWAGSRDWSTHVWNYDLTGANSPLGVVGRYAVGSGTTPAGRVFIVDRPGQAQPNPSADPRIDLYNQLVTAYPTATSFVPDASQPLGWRPWLGAALPQYGGDQYNYQPANYLVTPRQRISIFATGDARLGDRARGFFEASYVNRESQEKLAPEPFLTGADGIVVSAGSQYNPFGLDLYDVRRRLMELGNRTYTQSVDTLRLVAGLDGALPDGLGPLRGWFWELSFNHGRTQGTELKQGYTRISALRSALGPSKNGVCYATYDPTSATPYANPIPGCVPLDLFGGPGSLTQEQAAALTFDGTTRGTNQMSALQLTLSGELFRLLAERPAGLALGYEYRKLYGSFVPDPVTAAGDASTDAALSITRGAQDVHEAYAELSIPVLEDRPPLGKLLEAQLAARVFRYSGFGTDWTWKLGGRWKPIRDLTLRGTLSTAFRAPSVFELYFGQWAQFATPHDPCAGVDDRGNPEPVSPWCGPAANNGSQYPFITSYGGGNPKLRPEVARIFTAGVVLEPRFVRDLSLTLDLWGVVIDKTIRTPLGRQIDACYPMSAAVTPKLCEYVHRDPASGALTDILDVPVNLGTEKLSGVDLAGRYALPTPAGRFGLAVDATWLRRYDMVLADGSVLHIRGNYDYPGNGAVNPAWKLSAGLTWQRGDVGAGLSTRYIGPMKECADATGNFGFGSGSTFCSFDHAYERRSTGYATWDASLRYGVDTSAGRTEVIGGVQNLLDARPAVVYRSVYASDPGYDFVGRFFHLRLSHRL